MFRICSAVALILLGACAPTPQTPKTEAEVRIAELDKEGRARGFVPVMRQDGRYYCHTYTPTTSHIEQKECISEYQMEVRVREDPAHGSFWGEHKPPCQTGLLGGC
jgi:hypothetical protein